MPTNAERQQYVKDKETRHENLVKAEARVRQLMQTDSAHDHFKLDRSTTDIAAKPAILARRKDDHTKWDRVG